MLRRLPPLNALKAFEAAARHESLTRAAEELFVTQGAVSRQVKALEIDRPRWQRWLSRRAEWSFRRQHGPASGAHRRQPRPRANPAA